MKFITAAEAKTWCETRGLKLTKNRTLEYEAVDPFQFSIEFENAASSRVISLADYIVPTWEDVPFRGALMWIRERGIWGDASENAGAAILTQMRLGNGEEAPLDIKPGYLFGPEEVIELHSFLLMPMLFGWDAFLIPDGGDYFFFISHDGYVNVVSCTQQAHALIKNQVSHWSNPSRTS